MIKFYLYSTDTSVAGGGKEIHCNTNSSITEVAGSIDLGTMELEWNECKHAIFPNTPFFIVDTETSQVWSYVISQDNVEVVRKTNPVKYLHTLSLSQRAHKLNFHQLRNTYFSQPYDSDKTIQSNHAFGVGSIFDENGTSRWHSMATWDGSCYFSTPLNSHSYLGTYFKTTAFASNKTKIQYAKIEMWDQNRYYDSFYWDGNNFNFSSVQTVEYRENTWQTAIIRIYDANDVGEYIELTLDKTIADYVFLTQTQCNWLSGREIYIKPISMTISQPDSNSIKTQTFDEEDFPWNEKIYNILGFLHITFTANSYYYSLYDVLDTIEKQCRREHNGLTKEPIYKMPLEDSEKGKILKETIAPEFRFNDLDLFSAVAEVLSYIDAFPLLTDDGTLDFEYLNDLSNDEIVDLEVNDKKTTLNESYFANKMISTYQNSKQSNAIVYPSSDTFKYSVGDHYGTPSRDEYYMIVDKPIDYLDKVLLLSPSNTRYDISIVEYEGFIDGSSTKWSYPDFQLVGLSTTNRIDITRYCFREDAYWLLPHDFADNPGANLYNTLRYIKGDNKIYLGVTGPITNQQKLPGEYDALEFVIKQTLLFNCGFRARDEFEISSQNKILKENAKYNVTYHGIFEGRTAQESTANKYEGEVKSAQQNAGGEINRMGNNMQGLLARLGNEEKTIVLPITEFKNKVKIGTLWEDENGNDWFVNQIQTTFTTKDNKVIVHATLTKDFNMIQQFTKVNQEKRFYEFDDNLTTKGFENVNEYLYFTNRDINVSTLNDNETALTDYGVLCLFANVFNTEQFIEDFGPNRYKGPYTRNIQASFLYNVDLLEIFYIPTHVYGSGNAICVEMGFESPINAGNRTQSRDGIIITEPTIYVADDGFMDSFMISSYEMMKYDPLTDLYWKDFSRDFPEVTSTEITNNYHTMSPNNHDRRILNLSMNYYKKPNEIFYLNYSINFMPYWRKTLDSLKTPIYTYDEIFFGNQFIEHNTIIPGVSYNYTQIKLYGCSKKMSFIENIIDPSDNIYTLLGITQAEFSSTYDGTDWVKYNGVVEFKIDGQSVDISNYTSWFITDAENNILISVNNNDASMTTAKLKFFKSRVRKT